MSDLPKRTPVVDAESRPYFEAAAEGRLSLPRCDDCGFVIFYPRDHCPSCHSHRTRWVDLSGEGTLYSFSVVHRAPGRWREATPYAVAYVELEEGPRILTNIVDCDPLSLEIGMRVRARFVEVDDGLAIVRFAPA